MNTRTDMTDLLVPPTRERPILFQGDMVRAILNGSKTQTRRVMKPQPDTRPGMNCTRLIFKDRKGNPLLDEALEATDPVYRVFCPYGQVGDRLWVRESFWGCDMPGYGDQPCVVYDDEWHGKEYRPAEVRPWARKFGRIPSIHMPRDCSRITLEITEVRVERLNSISEADAQAEGVYTDPACPAYEGYRDLWTSINGPGSWDLNPWVWCVSFRRVVA